MWRLISSSPKWRLENDNRLVNDFLCELTLRTRSSSILTPSPWPNLLFIYGQSWDWWWCYMRSSRRKEFIVGSYLFFQEAFSVADGMPRRKGSWKGYPNRQVEVVQRRILFSGWTIGENEMRYIILTDGSSLHHQQLGTNGHMKENGRGNRL